MKKLKIMVEILEIIETSKAEKIPQKPEKTIPIICCTSFQARFAVFSLLAGMIWGESPNHGNTGNPEHAHSVSFSLMH